MKNKQAIIGAVLLTLVFLTGVVLAYDSPEQAAEKIIQGTQEYKWHLHDRNEGIRSEIKIHEDRIDRLNVELTETVNEWNRQDGIEQGAKLMLESFTKENQSQ